MSAELTERIVQKRVAGGITVQARELSEGYELAFFREGEHLRTFYVEDEVARQASSMSIDTADMLKEMRSAIAWNTPFDSAP